MNFKDREQWLGITQPSFRRKFVFEGQESPDAFYFDRLQPTPSELDGLSELDEDRVRSIACQMITEAGVFLRLPVTTVVAAQTILQFFYQRCSLLKHDFRDIVMGALFLASKSEQTIRRSAHVALVFDQVFKVHFSGTQIHEKERRPVRVADVNSYEFKCMQAKVLESQRLILFELGFEVYRLLETPHRYMSTLFLEFNRHKRINQIVKKAWGYLNDSFRTRVCVHYPGQIIAAACMYLSLRSLGIPAPSVPWWCLMEAKQEMIEVVAADILSLYERCDTFSVVQEALTRAGSAKNIQHVFPVTYYRRIILANREAQRLKAQAKQLEFKAMVAQQVQSLPPVIQQKAVGNIEVRQPKPSEEPPVLTKKQPELSRTRSRSNRKDKHKKRKHRHRSRSSDSERDRSRDKRRRSRSRSRNSRKRREDSRDRKKKHKKERKSDGEDSKQNITKSSGEPLEQENVVNDRKVSDQPDKVQEEISGQQEANVNKAVLDKEQIKKQIQQQMKARLLKRPEITQPPAPTQPLPPAQNPKPTVEEDSPDELSMIAELKAKIVLKKKLGQSTSTGPA